MKFTWGKWSMVPKAVQDLEWTHEGKGKCNQGGQGKGKGKQEGQGKGKSRGKGKSKCKGKGKGKTINYYLSQKSIFCIVIAIFVNGANNHYTRGYNFPIGTTPQKIPFPS